MPDNIEDDYPASAWMDDDEWYSSKSEDELFDPFKNDQTTKAVLGELGIDSFDKLFLTDKFIGENPDALRRNSFGSIADLIIWLKDTGLIAFGGVYKQGEELVPVVPPSDRRRRK